MHFWIIIIFLEVIGDEAADAEKKASVIVANTTTLTFKEPQLRLLFKFALFQDGHVFSYFALPAALLVQ